MRILRKRMTKKEREIIDSICPLSIVISFSTNQINKLHKTLYYLNRCKGIEECEIVLVLYENQYYELDLCEYTTFSDVRFIHSYRNNKDNIFNQGHSKNIGIRHAKYDWVLCIDNDIIIPEHTLAVLSCSFCRSPNYFYYTDRITVELIDYRSIHNFSKSLSVSSEPLGYFGFYNKNVMLDRTGGWDERCYGWGIDDIDFYRRCIRSGMRLFDLSKYFAVYHEDHKYSKSWKATKYAERNNKFMNQNKQSNQIKMQSTGIILTETV